MSDAGRFPAATCWFCDCAPGTAASIALPFLSLPDHQDVRVVGLSLGRVLDRHCLRHLLDGDLLIGRLSGGHGVEDRQQHSRDHDTDTLELTH